MALKRGVIESILKELDRVVSQLNKYCDLQPDAMKKDLEKRWVIERGLEAGAQLVLEIADQILSNNFGNYCETYEGTLSGLFEKNVISENLYRQIKGLGEGLPTLRRGNYGLDRSTGRRAEKRHVKRAIAKFGSHLTARTDCSPGSRT